MAINQKEMYPCHLSQNRAHFSMDLKTEEKVKCDFLDSSDHETIIRKGMTCNTILL